MCSRMCVGYIQIPQCFTQVAVHLGITGADTVINPCQTPRGDIIGAMARGRHRPCGGLQGGGDLNLAFPLGGGG